METALGSASKRVVIGPEQPFVIIGERINPTGRKRLAAEMAEGKLDTVLSDARAQIEAGALVLDVNAGVPGADEIEMMRRTVLGVVAVTDIPLSIDSASPAVLEAGLAAFAGKALVNSVTAEPSSLERVLPIAKEHGAAVIGMANDGSGVSMDPKIRLEAARTIVEAAADHGIAPEDVLIDPLVMTVGADPQAAKVTLETIRLVREELGVNTTCGASNVSFGLPDRHGIDAAFLPMAIHAGLTSAITNPLVPAVRKAILAADVLLGNDDYAMSWIAQHRATLAEAGS